MKLYVDYSIDESGIISVKDFSCHSHDKEYRLRKSQVHIKRKRHILKNVYKMTDEDVRNNNHWNSNGKLSKRKVHCSCPFCATKTRKDGWKHGDKVKMAKGWEMSEDSIR